jgi:hypothetical protein
MPKQDLITKSLATTKPSVIIVIVATQAIMRFKGEEELAGDEQDNPFPSRGSHVRAIRAPPSYRQA